MRDELECEERPRRQPRNRGVAIEKTAVGLGVFARQRFQADELIGQIEGDVIDDPAYTSRYCMDMGGSACLEPSAPFRFVNHSCEPNCYFECYETTSEFDKVPRRRVFLFTSADISPGDQLTIDYAWPPGMAIRCRCGSASCRGWIVAPERLEELLADLAGAETAPA